MIKNYWLKNGYKATQKINTKDNSQGEVFWNKKHILTSHHAQYFVYRFAHDYAVKNGIKKILDIGCGTGIILKEIFFKKQFELYGVDQESAEKLWTQNIPNGKFFVEDIEHPQYKLKEILLTAPLIICADIIEHLDDPDTLLRYIQQFADSNTKIILSTPERDLLHGTKNNSPTNPYHVREWNQQELRSYLEYSNFTVLEQKIVASTRLGFDLRTFKLLLLKLFFKMSLEHTQIVICQTKNSHSQK